MRNSTFKQPTIEEVRAKQAEKRTKINFKPLKARKAVTRRPKAKTQAWYKKELDRVFSIYIRQRDDGQCFTCPKKDDPKRMQNGHFVPRQYLTVRWDERNCNCQCYACNMLYGGQGATYSIRLKEKYGQEVVEWLESQRWVSVKLDIPWYEEQINKYKLLITPLKILHTQQN
jgi:hypothetical protein